MKLGWMIREICLHFIIYFASVVKLTQF